MRFENKEIILKGGQRAILRSASASDAEELLKFIKTACGQTHFLMRYPEEYNMTVEDERNILSELEESDNRLMICCEIDGKIAGNCQLGFNTAIKTAHRVRVAVAVLKDYWQKGIATALFEEMIEIARQKGVLQMELEFAEGNERAHRLYEKLGFVIVAEKPDAFRLKDGTMLKEYHMIKYL